MTSSEEAPHTTFSQRSHNIWFEESACVVNTRADLAACQDSESTLRLSKRLYRCKRKLLTYTACERVDLTAMIRPGSDRAAK
eukprot:14292350-Heterocapsa_arctica.AAC.1